MKMNLKPFLLVFTGMLSIQSLAQQSMQPQPQPQPQSQPQPPGAFGIPVAQPQVSATPPTPVNTANTQTPQAQQPRRLPIPIAPPTVREIVETTVNDANDTVLRPNEVGRLRDSTMRARQRQTTPTYPGNVMPKPISRTINIDPDPAQQPRMVRMSQATITSFVFSDTSGNPWIIDSRSFDSSAFSDGTTGCGAQQQMGKDVQHKPSNILNMQPCDPYAFGNVVITLKGFPVPIVFMLSTGQSNEVDVRVAARILGVNPDARAEIVQAEAMPEHDDVMQDFLDGVPPAAAKPLKMSGGGQAWIYGGSMYIRTRMQVYSPAFRGHVGSADGMHVYKFSRAEPRVILAHNGSPETIAITGY